MGGEDGLSLHEKGVHAVGLYIAGTLDLFGVRASAVLGLAACRFEDEVNIRDAELAGLFIQRSRLVSLFGERVRCRGSISLTASHVALVVKLGGAQIAGDLDFNDARFGQLDGESIHADGIRVEGDLLMLRDFKAQGSVRIPGAEIGGDLMCAGGAFRGGGSDALLVDRSRIKGGVYLNYGFTAIGQVSLSGMTVGGDIQCDTGNFYYANGACLAIDRTTVRGCLFMNDVHAHSEVRLTGADLGSLECCEKSRFKNEGGYCLTAERLVVKGNVLFSEDFSALGKCNLSGARIEGDLCCGPASFENDEDAFVATGAVVKGTFTWRRMGPLRGGLVLDSARVGSLADDWESYSGLTDLVLDGFHYERISAGPTDAATRAKWLRLQNAQRQGKEFWPQPWEHLARVLREMGHAEDARLIAMEKQKEMRRLGVIGNRQPRAGLGRPWRWLEEMYTTAINRFARILHQFYGGLAGYGYRPLRTAGWMVVGWLMCAAIYHAGEMRGFFGPTAPLLLTQQQLSRCGVPGEEGTQAWTRCGSMPPEHTRFSALMYSLDVILPLVDLRQESEWTPVAHSFRDGEAWIGAAIRATMWVEILFGWIASLLLVSAVGRLVQKD